MHNTAAVSAAKSAEEPQQAEGSRCGQQPETRKHVVAVKGALQVHVAGWRAHTLHGAGVNTNLCVWNTTCIAGDYENVASNMGRGSHVLHGAGVKCRRQPVRQRSTHAAPATCMDDNDMLTHIVCGVVENMCGDEEVPANADDDAHSADVASWLQTCYSATARVCSRTHFSSAVSSALRLSLPSGDRCIIGEHPPS